MTKVFIVGGAVRDMLLHKTPKDVDFVVVGSSPEEMIELGFTQVGADFPVFLHPHTKDEFALARTERKSGSGYNGFECDWNGVTIEEDLSRRDLTINSMAIEMPMDLEDISFRQSFVWNLIKESMHLEISKGNNPIIDPFGGQKDIEQQSLRHTTDAFAEDPLRVLRVARFLARFGEEWRIHHSTKLMMKKIHNAGELKNLTAERIWLETEKALSEPNPEMFFETFQKLDLGVFDEVNALHGVEQRADHHPEIDTFVHVMMCIQQGVKMNLSTVELFAVLVHDLGKRTTMDERGNLHGNKAEGVPLIDQMAERIKIPNEHKKLGKMVAEHHTRVHRAFDATPKSVFKTIEVCDAIRKPERFKSFLKCCEADARGRLGFENREYPQHQFFLDVLEIVSAVDTASIAEEIKNRHFSKIEKAKQEKIDIKISPLGPKIGEAIRVARINSIRGMVNDHSKNK